MSPSQLKTKDGEVLGPVDLISRQIQARNRLSSDIHHGPVQSAVHLLHASRRIRPIDTQEPLSYEEITRLVEVAARLGVKVRIAGGEPLARKNPPVPDRIARRDRRRRTIDLTANGLLLKQLARTLASAGLVRGEREPRFTLPGRYRRITRAGTVTRLTVARLKRRACCQVKINVIPHARINDDEIESSLY